jgi:hypothetical protein
MNRKRKNMDCVQENMNMSDDGVVLAVFWVNQ